MGNTMINEIKDTNREALKDLKKQMDNIGINDSDIKGAEILKLYNKVCKKNEEVDSMISYRNYRLRENVGKLVRKINEYQLNEISKKYR